MTLTTIRNTFAAVSLGVILAACGGGSGSAQGSDDTNAIPRPVVPTPGEPGPEDSPASKPEPEPELEPEPTPEPGPKPTPEPDPIPEPEPVDRNAYLQWDAPTTRIDDACLTGSDLTAYHISYGLAPDTYTETLKVAVEDLSCTDTTKSSACGPIQTCSYTVENLGTASWYFAVQAVDGNGMASDFSNEAIKTIE